MTSPPSYSNPPTHFCQKRSLTMIRRWWQTHEEKVAGTNSEVKKFWLFYFFFTGFNCLHFQIIVLILFIFSTIWYGIRILFSNLSLQFFFLVVTGHNNDEQYIESKREKRETQIERGSTICLRPQRGGYYSLNNYYTHVYLVFHWY
jgi:predicted membrane protein